MDIKIWTTLLAYCWYFTAFEGFLTMDKIHSNGYFSKDTSKMQWELEKRGIISCAGFKKSSYKQAGIVNQTLGWETTWVINLDLPCTHFQCFKTSTYSFSKPSFLKWYSVKPHVKQKQIKLVFYFCPFSVSSHIYWVKKRGSSIIKI